MKSTAVKNYISMWNYTKHPSTRFAKVNETSTMVRLRKRFQLLDCSFVKTVRKTFRKKIICSVFTEEVCRWFCSLKTAFMNNRASLYSKLLFLSIAIVHWQSIFLKPLPWRRMGSKIIYPPYDCIYFCFHETYSFASGVLTTLQTQKNAKPATFNEKASFSVCSELQFWCAIFWSVTDVPATFISSCSGSIWYNTRGHILWEHLPLILCWLILP